MMEDSDALSVFEMSNRLRNFVLVAVIAENPACIGTWWEMEMFSALLWISLDTPLWF